MRLTTLCRYTSVLAIVTATPALAQDGAAEPAEQSSAYEAEDGQIVVIAGRYFGGVEAPQQPVLSLDEADIASYGAGSLAELVEALGPAATSARGRGGGRPMVLVNGQRISGFRELRSYPPEALRRVEVLPEEVAQRYGFSPDQRVINFILKDNFSSREIELAYGQPTRGGYHTTEAELTYLRIDGPDRLNLGLEFNNATPLLQEDRGVIQRDAPDVAGDPDPAAFRSLVNDTASMAFNGTWTRGLGASGGSLAINASAQRDDSLALRGLDSVMLTDPDGRSALRTFDAASPLRNDRRTTSYALGGTLSHPVGDWQLTATLDANHTRNRNLTDRRRDTSALEALALAGALPVDGVLPAIAGARGQDRALTREAGITSLVTLNGTPLRLPAGGVSATISLGYEWDRISSTDTRSSGPATRLKRGDLSAGVDLALPLTSRRENVLGGIGDITLSLGGGIDRFSDFGTLHDWSAGLTWQPTRNLSFQASYIWREAAPSLTDLGNPQIVQPNEPIFDFVTGQSVLAAIITGGNPLLRAETQSDLKFSGSWQLPFLSGASLTAEYIRNRSRDVTAGFPLLTPSIEQAFPGRVIRDSDGQLLTLDRRPVTFAEQNWKRLRYGLEISGQFGKAPEPTEGEGRRGGEARDPRSMVMGPGGGRGRWGLSAYHTVEFANRVLIEPGGPVLDLLNGDALSGGGAPRHKAEMELRFFRNGIGGRFSGKYHAPTLVRGSGLPGSTDLSFGSLATLDMRLFIDLGVPGRILQEPGFLNNTRLVLKANNVFDARQKVRDENGNTPLRYQPGLVDPVGRFVAIELRKMF